jgi:hypothetical protein
LEDGYERLDPEGQEEEPSDSILDVISPQAQAIEQPSLGMAG